MEESTTRIIRTSTAVEPTGNSSEGITKQTETGNIKVKSEAMNFANWKSCI